jgi:hypothetical protein
MLASVSFAHLDRLAPQVCAVQLQQVEGIQEGSVLLPALAELLEDGQASFIAAHRFAIDQAGPHLEVVHSLHHRRIAA